MGILLTTIAGLALWIILWAIDVKSFDAFLITVLMVVIAATAHIVAPYPPGQPVGLIGTRAHVVPALCRG